MTANANSLRTALGDAMDIVTLTDERGKELVAPIFKQILALRDKNVPELTITALLDALKRCCSYNAALSVKAQAICNVLDTLTCAGTVDSALTIKALARKLGPALKVLADPHAHSAGEYVAAARTVNEIAGLVPRERLLSGSLPNELGGKRFRALTAQLTRADGVGGVGATIPGVAHLEGCRTPSTVATEPTDEVAIGGARVYPRSPARIPATSQHNWE
jgi:hypothetical protein